MIFCVSYNYIIEKAEILTLNENPTYVSDKRVCMLREVERYKFVRMSSRKMNMAPFCEKDCYRDTESQGPYRML